MSNMRNESSSATRRDFLKATTLAAAGAALASTAPGVHAAGSDVLKVGLIGCGGRGRGAAENALLAAPNIHVVALGDVFQEQLNLTRNHLLKIAGTDQVKKLGNKVDLADERCFLGLDAYEKVINSGVHYVILATPPGFRPLHLQAAVAAGKHIFTEKPVAVDGSGIRKVLAVHEEARQKGLAIVAGTQRRHQQPYRETIKRIHDGAIGDIVAGRCYWNTGDIWFRRREPGMSDVAYQIHNWYHFLWLCGDHIVEQHVHNLDVINWATGQHPLRALGMGGRVRPCKDPNVDGHIYNFFSIDYEYPKDVHVLSMCRQVSGCDANFAGVRGESEAVVGTKGTCRTSASTFTINGKNVGSGQGNNPYTQEHTALIESIRSGKPLNELKTVAESTLTAIMGRMSAYTGKVVSWQQALDSKQDLMPPGLAWDMSLPAASVPVPGKTKLL